MSGIQLGRLEPVQAPNYDAAINAYSHAGITDMGANGLLQGFNAMRQNNQQQGMLAIAQQRQAQESQLQQMQIFQAKKQYVADTAFGITQLPEDKQKDAYNHAVIGLAQNGMLDPADVKHWDDGGKEMVQQAAVQSPRAAAAAKYQLDMMKTGADIGLTQARTANQVAQTALAGGGKPLTGNDAKVLEMSADASNQVTQLKSLYGQTANPNISGMLPNALESSNVQQVNFLKNNLADMIGHLRAGARINDQQQQKFLGFLPKVGDSDATAAFKLDSLKAGLDNIATSIRPVGNLTPGADKEMSGYSAAATQYPGLTQEQYKSLVSKKS